MIPVIAVSKNDVHLAKQWGDWVNKLQHVSDFRAVISATPDIAEEAREFLYNLKRSFKSVDLFILPAQPQKGWPSGPNSQFTQTAQYIYKTYNEAWLWMELDAIPMHDRWLLNLDKEYYIHQRPYMGTIRRVNLPEQSEGYYILGVAVYPGDFIKRCPWVSTANMAFDTFIRGETLPGYTKGMDHPRTHDTKLIQDNWRTKNYRDEYGVIKFDLAEGGNPLAVGPIRPGLSLLHGCKDGTLIKILDKRSASREPIATGNPCVGPSSPCSSSSASLNFCPHCKQPLQTCTVESSSQSW